MPRGARCARAFPGASAVFPWRGPGPIHAPSLPEAAFLQAFRRYPGPGDDLTAQATRLPNSAKGPGNRSVHGPVPVRDFAVVAYLRTSLPGGNAVADREWRPLLPFLSSVRQGRRFLPRRPEAWHTHRTQHVPKATHFGRPWQLLAASCCAMGHVHVCSSKRWRKPGVPHCPLALFGGAEGFRLDCHRVRA